MGNHNSTIDGKDGGVTRTRDSTPLCGRHYNPWFRCDVLAAATATSKRDTRRWSEQIHIFHVA